MHIAKKVVRGVKIIRKRGLFFVLPPPPLEEIALSLV